MAISPGWRVEEYLIQRYLSSIFSVRLYLRIPLQEAHGVPYLSQKLYSHNPSVLALMLAMTGTKQAPHKLHSVSFLSLSLFLT